MKKLFVSIALVLIGIISANAQIVWGIRAGLSIPTVSTSTTYTGDWGGETYDESLKGKIGIELGPVMYYAFNEKLYINPALMFSIKTFDLSLSGDSKVSMYYAELPVYLGYRIPIGTVTTYLQAGPYAGFKIGESLPSDWGDAETGLKSFDAGLAIMYGVNIKRFKIEAGYKLGLTNISDLSGYMGEGMGYTSKSRMSSIFLGINYVF
ncbi:MAG: PorT family protein [Prevotellaceae bacterium]|jgi:hypothetical protein|nr:PorT family protein [Prevotellaceae bacterium]